MADYSSPRVYSPKVEDLAPGFGPAPATWRFPRPIPGPPVEITPLPPPDWSRIWVYLFPDYVKNIGGTGLSTAGRGRGSSVGFG